jgi:hypothetical protein
MSVAKSQNQSSFEDHKLAQKFFSQWKQTFSHSFTKSKVQTTIRTMAAATRILDLFNQHNVVRVAFMRWQQYNERGEQYSLGYQMLVNVYKKKLRHYLLLAHNNTKIINEAEKIQRIKAKVVCQIMN